MRKGLVTVVMAVAFASVGFAQENTSSSQSWADRFKKFKEEATEKAKEKTRDLFDKEKKAKEQLKEAAQGVADKVIDRFVPGGDKKAAKDIAGAIISGQPLKAIWHIAFSPSETSEHGNGVVPDNPFVQANPSNGNAPTTTQGQPTPALPAGPSNANASSPKSEEQNGHGGGVGVGPQHESNTTASNNAPANQSNSGESQAQPNNIRIEARKETMVQADPNINPNRELTTHESSSQRAATPAPAATPASAATPAPAPAPAPAPTPTPNRDHPTVEHPDHLGGSWAGGDHPTAGDKA